MDLKPCPFCGGKARITAKDYRYVGNNGRGEKFRQFKFRAICNGCRTMGKPIISEPTSENVWVFLRGNESEFLSPYSKKAAEAWNTRI